MNCCLKIHSTTWYSLTDCRAFTPYIRSKVKYVKQLRDIVADYLPSQPEQPKRIKRGTVNLGGEVLKFLFGTLTQSVAKKYTQHIQRLEDEQQSFLRISQEQMVVLKSAIMSLDISIERVDRNKRILTENLQRLNKMVVEEINQMQMQIGSVMKINENIQQIQREIEECQHTFEILVDAFLHAQDGVVQPQLITMAKIKDMMRKESLPDGLDFPTFPSLELSKLITPIIFSQNSYLVYILQMPLLQSTPINYTKFNLSPWNSKRKCLCTLK